MIESSYALYKLIILYMLDKVSFPLSNAQISEFFLEKEYTSYFHLQEVINEMVDSELISKENTQNTTFYGMTDNGSEVLHFFSNDISTEIKEDTDTYLKEHAFRLRTESSTTSDYYKTANDDYAVHCVVRENGAPMIDMTLYVPTERSAQELCEKWKQKSQEAYAALIGLLM